MQCPVYHYLSPYADGELEASETKKVREHLKGCVACQEELNLLLEIRNCLKRAALSAKTPATLREKILGEAQRGRSTGFLFRKDLAYAYPLVAVLIVAIAIFYYWPRERDPFKLIVASMVKYHSAYASGERAPGIRSSNVQDVESWLKGYLDFKILIPHAAFAGYDLVGGDIFEQRGRKFVYLKYQQGIKVIGYVIFEDFALPIDLPETIDIDKITVHVGKIQGTNIGAWKRGELVYSVLTTEDRSELIEYIQLCIQLF